MMMMVFFFASVVCCRRFKRIVIIILLIVGYNFHFKERILQQHEMKLKRLCEKPFLLPHPTSRWSSGGVLFLLNDSIRMHFPDCLFRLFLLKTCPQIFFSRHKYQRGLIQLSLWNFQQFSPGWSTFRIGRFFVYLSDAKSTPRLLPYSSTKNLSVFNFYFYIERPNNRVIANFTNVIPNNFSSLPLLLNDDTR